MAQDLHGIIASAGLFLVIGGGLAAMCWDTLAEGRHCREMARRRMDLTRLQAENDRLRAELARADVETRP